LKKININNKTYYIVGEWSINLATKVYAGNVLDKNNKKIMPLDFKIPLSAIKNYGLKYFEDCIEKDLIIELGKNIK